ncbi:MAG: hypothetical protein ACFE9L_01555 [Candidatus Hodarchaeota archaeon]
MSSIAYFISDYGYGHASRSIAIIRSLLECDLEISFEVHTSKPLNFVKKSLMLNNESNRVSFHKQLNDLGFIGEKITGKINYQDTAKLIHPWVQNWGSTYLFEEYRYLKSRKIDLIVSDIAPQPFLLAKRLQIPSIAISNFTWCDFYQHSSFRSEDIDIIWKAYREASLGLLLPFNLENTVFPSILETALVSRNPQRQKAQMYELLDIDPSTQVIYTGTGISMNNPFRQEWLDNTDAIFILGSHSKIEARNIRTIPSDEHESQDFIACSDLALIKLGYSSISEAIRSHIPIIGVDFAKTPETKFMAKQVQELGIGICITSQEYFDGDWLKYIPEVLEMRQNYSQLPERFRSRGESQIANIILTILEETC